MIAKWRRVCPDTRPQSWVFPSETGKTPISRENCWRRNVAPNLDEVRLDCVNFQALRRTHATLMRELDVDPKVVADQLAHTLDVNLNIPRHAAWEATVLPLNYSRSRSSVYQRHSARPGRTFRRVRGGLLSGYRVAFWRVGVGWKDLDLGLNNIGMLLLAGAAGLRQSRMR